ncbi:glutamate racemase [Clostridium cellulovorans]|uniref:Glutamate racemase n=1 Tax=Clostridium cellulovorans (strain ATCC 35296 / DSM 3052 / OCM 3 / 743B) TaxID=573061 RepID=D9SKW6_CLOC7|nr:glutamate racemase [Clostridium cellulovorans]ADL53538.1 glutamate racemase [Clostridium cellulovorans 743B]
MQEKYKPIGFMDSGVGGLSVMKEAIKALPQENLIHFGDSKNAPYGIKTDEEIKKLTFSAVEFLIKKQCKAIVIACNTATSVAINDLREIYKEVPIIGIEPAVKPAVELNEDGKIIVMATPVTLKKEKFNHLLEMYGSDREIIFLPCPELVELIERGVLEGEELDNYLLSKFKPYLNDKISAVVLGCTHYPFAKKAIKKIVGDAKIIDGSYGTVKQLKNILMRRDELNDSNSKGTIEIFNSLNSNDILELCNMLLSAEVE